MVEPSSAPGLLQLLGARPSAERERGGLAADGDLFRKSLGTAEDSEREVESGRTGAVPVETSPSPTPPEPETVQIGDGAADTTSEAPAAPEPDLSDAPAPNLPRPTVPGTVQDTPAGTDTAGPGLVRPGAPIEVELPRIDIRPAVLGSTPGDAPVETASDPVAPDGRPPLPKPIEGDLPLPGGERLPADRPGRNGGEREADEPSIRDAQRPTVATGERPTRPGRGDKPAPAPVDPTEPRPVSPGDPSATDELPRITTAAEAARSRLAERLRDRPDARDGSTRRLPTTGTRRDASETRPLPGDLERGGTETKPPVDRIRTPELPGTRPLPDGFSRFVVRETESIEQQPIRTTTPQASGETAEAVLATDTATGGVANTDALPPVDANEAVAERTPQDPAVETSVEDQLSRPVENSRGALDRIESPDVAVETAEPTARPEQPELPEQPEPTRQPELTKQPELAAPAEPRVDPSAQRAAADAEAVRARLERLFVQPVADTPSVPDAAAGTPVVIAVSGPVQTAAPADVTLPDNTSVDAIATEPAEPHETRRPDVEPIDLAEQLEQLEQLEQAGSIQSRAAASRALADQAVFAGNTAASTVRKAGTPLAVDSAQSGGTPTTGQQAPSVLDPVTSGSAPIRVNHQGLAEAIVARARVVPDNGALEVRFALEPDDLGTVRIRIESRGEQMTIRILAATAGAVDALSNGISRLTSQLQEAGVREPVIDVTLEDTAQRQAQQQQRQQGDGASGSRSTRRMSAGQAPTLGAMPPTSYPTADANSRLNRIA